MHAAAGPAHSHWFLCHPYEIAFSRDTKGRDIRRGDGFNGRFSGDGQWIGVCRPYQYLQKRAGTYVTHYRPIAPLGGRAVFERYRFSTRLTFE